MDILDAGSYYLRNIDKINIILGKNGCGKSSLLKEVEKYCFLSSHYGKVKYITPERGGILMYEPNVEHTITNNISWMSEDRRRNRSESFRQQSVVQFRNLELLFLREMEKNMDLRVEAEYNFDNYIVDRINSLLGSVDISHRQP